MNIGASIDEFEISCPSVSSTALVELASSVMNGAKAVPTHRNTGAKMVHWMSIRMMFPRETK